MESNITFLNALISSFQRQITRFSGDLAQAEAKNIVLEVKLEQAEKQIDLLKPKNGDDQRGNKEKRTNPG